MKETKKQIEEKEITSQSGFIMLFVTILGFIASIAIFIVGVSLSEHSGAAAACGIILGFILFIVCCIFCGGFHVINPNEAMVMTLFGSYYGTIKKPGFYFTNPFAGAVAPSNPQKESNAKSNLQETQTAVTIDLNTKKKVSLKTMTLDNGRQKVNDVLGNPIIIGAIVIWKVTDPTKAVFNVENYQTYLSIQCDSTIRKITRLYPYDLLDEDESEEADEKTLRGSSQEIAESMRDELQLRVADAGIEVEEVRITHLSYAEEIAAAMLQKQQAAAVIAARKKIVEGAVGMVDMAIKQLNDDEIVLLDDERKAAMVSNLLVVLCGNKEAQPIVNSGSIY